MWRGSSGRSGRVWVVLAVFAAVCLVGCGPAASEGERAAFSRAVEEYLQAQSMDLSVRSIRAAEVSGGKATVTASLTHAGGAVGVAVQWEFDLERRGGTWHVTGHRR